jgi:hypothetical protein
VDIQVTFDQAMDEASVEDPNNWSLLDPNTNPIAATSITYTPSTRIVVFDPSISLPDGTYQITLAGAVDHAANALDGRCPGGVCDSPAEIPTGDPNQAVTAFVAAFGVDDPNTPSPPPPPLFDPVLDVDSGGALNWTPPPVPPGGTTPVYNLYRGDMEAFLVSGIYTQDPSQAPEAMKACGVTGSSYSDGFSPAPGRLAFYLVAEVVAGVEMSLGLDSQGQARPSEGLCGATSNPSGP